jgi:hypothetical protein
MNREPISSWKIDGMEPHWPICNQPWKSLQSELKMTPKGFFFKKGKGGGGGVQHKGLLVVKCFRLNDAKIICFGLEKKVWKKEKIKQIP